MMSRTLPWLALSVTTMFGAASYAFASDDAIGAINDGLMSDSELSAILTPEESEMPNEILESEMVSEEDLANEEGLATDPMTVAPDDADALVVPPPGHRRPGWGHRRPGWGRPGWGRPGRGLISCFASDRYGRRYMARGYGSPWYIQRQAVNYCRTRSNSYCYATGCRRGF